MQQIGTIVSGINEEPYEVDNRINKWIKEENIKIISVNLSSMDTDDNYRDAYVILYEKISE